MWDATAADYAWDSAKTANDDIKALKAEIEKLSLRVRALEVLAGLR